MTWLNIYDYTKYLANIDSLTPAEANDIRHFIRAKIENGTLYTPDELLNYTEIKRSQLIFNSNIAEHAQVDVLGAELLDSNDRFTLDSTAVLEKDGYAKADLTIDDTEVEAKVVYTEQNLETVFKAAHKKPIVSAYVIRPFGTTHWTYYIRSFNDKYIPVDFGSCRPDLCDSQLAEKAFNWQTKMREEKPVLSLIRFKELEDNSVEVGHF